MKNSGVSNYRLRSQRGFSMLAIAIFAVAVLSAVLISWKAMKRSSDVTQMRSLIASPEVNRRTSPTDIAGFISQHVGVDGVCAVQFYVDDVGNAQQVGASAQIPLGTASCMDIAQIQPMLNGGRRGGIAIRITTNGNMIDGLNLIQADATSYGAPPAPSPTANCFPGSTLVLTSRIGGVNSYRRIDSLRPGDQVVAISDISPSLLALSGHRLSQRRARKIMNEVTLNTEQVEVGALIVHDPATENIVRLDFGSSSLLTTASHPFFVIGSGWDLVSELKVGSKLLTIDGRALVIRGIREEAPQPVLYNLHLPKHHTFFVRDNGSPVLSHNATIGGKSGGVS